MSAVAVGADVRGAVPFGCFLHHVGIAAGGAGDGNRPVPAGETAFWIAVAPVKDLAPFGGFFHNLAITSFFGAGDTGGLGIGSAVE